MAKKEQEGCFCHTLAHLPSLISLKPSGEQFDNTYAPCIVDEHMKWLVEAKPPVSEGVNG